MDIILIIGAAGGVAAIIGCALLLLMMRRLSIHLAEAERRIESLATNLSALCSGAVGVDRRVARLERHGRDLKHRQENIESNGKQGHSYGDAIQMVRHGASAERLMAEQGLSRNEADLIVMLHGMKEAG